MSKIAILTDSSCDIPQEMAEKYGIDIMSFHILLDDVDYVERVDCTNTEFYDKMRAAKGVPSTAAITPIQFCEKYCQYVDEGYTDVIHVPINKSGSSTYNNALMAQGMLREERPEHHLNIHLLDPHTYSMVFGWYLCEMARKLQNGAEIRHVIHEFEQQMNCMEVVLGPYSLRQMKKSGRISAAAAVMGELMGIRPIITLIDGKTKVEAKVRGDEKVVPAMVELCQKRAGDVEDFEYMIGHTNIPQAADLEKLVDKKVGVSSGSTSAKALVKAMIDAGLIDGSGFDADTFDPALWTTGISFQQYDDYPAISTALSAGEVDAFCVDKSILAIYKTDGRSYIDDKFSPQEYGVATTKGSGFSAYHCGASAQTRCSLAA